MRFYWVKTHFAIKKLFGNYIWDLPSKDKTVYLTFDDGPTPEITEWVLSQLERHRAKATFFCIGNNIANNPEIFKKVLDAGHAVGNHTYNHVNGWHIDDETYYEDVERCEEKITAVAKSARLFRPPYGKINRKQSKTLRGLGYKIIMWDILSADFDTEITPGKCLENVLKNVTPGSIIIFHDSVKAFRNLEYALPKTLEFLNKKGYKCAAIG